MTRTKILDRAEHEEKLWEIEAARVMAATRDASDEGRAHQAQTLENRDEAIRISRSRYALAKRLDAAFSNVFDVLDELHAAGSKAHALSTAVLRVSMDRDCEQLQSFLHIADSARGTDGNCLHAFGQAMTRLWYHPALGGRGQFREAALGWPRYHGRS